MSDDQQHIEALVARIRQRDETALSELYTNFGSAVYGLSFHVLQKHVLAEEATQDTFLKVWREINKWDPERGKFSTWLLTIARYTAIDRLRKEQRQTPRNEIDIEEQLEIIGQDDDVSSERWHNRALLKKLIAQLPSEQIQAIELAFFKGMSHTEIAEHLNEPLGTIKSRIRTGLHTLRGLWLSEAE